VHLLLVAYVAGVVVGLWKVDAAIGPRVGLALLWPAGVLAAAVTVPILIAAVLILFPVLAAAVAVALAGGWWFLG
jgi:hypothetical protein